MEEEEPKPRPEEFLPPPPFPEDDDFPPPPLPPPPGAASDQGPKGTAATQDGECKLLGPFALIVQGALGALALLSLVFKRWRERPRRPVKIWFFDVSKQVVGTFLLHLANLGMSMFSSGSFDVATKTPDDISTSVQADDGTMPNPCSFYLLNLAIDVSKISPDLCTAYADTRVDHHWHSCTGHLASRIARVIFEDTDCEPTRVYQIWLLRSATTSDLVAEAIIHLLHWAFRHEAVRLFALPIASVAGLGW